mmetsp:Transcript_20532/g.63838  ORF Transcript_20532/g.63838 Transcript_20532/m.63838 type:complete len:241 (-) Transcript_20532:246-968(-)
MRMRCMPASSGTNASENVVCWRAAPSPSRAASGGVSVAAIMCPRATLPSIADVVACAKTRHVRTSTLGRPHAVRGWRTKTHSRPTLPTYPSAGDGSTREDGGTARAAVTESEWRTRGRSSCRPEPAVTPMRAYPPPRSICSRTAEIICSESAGVCASSMVTDRRLRATSKRTVMTCSFPSSRRTCDEPARWYVGLPATYSRTVNRSKLSARLEPMPAQPGHATSPHSLPTSSRALRASPE